MAKAKKGRWNTSPTGGKGKGKRWPKAADKSQNMPKNWHSSYKKAFGS